MHELFTCVCVCVCVCTWDKVPLNITLYNCFFASKAKNIFKSMYPDEDFLPRAPDPEEIVLEGDETPGPKFEGGVHAEGEEKQDVEKAEKEEWTIII